MSRMSLINQDLSDTDSFYMRQVHSVQNRTFGFNLWNKLKEGNAFALFIPFIVISLLTMYSFNHFGGKNMFPNQKTKISQKITPSKNEDIMSSKIQLIEKKLAAMTESLSYIKASQNLTDKLSSIEAQLVEYSHEVESLRDQTNILLSAYTARAREMESIKSNISFIAGKMNENNFSPQLADFVRTVVGEAIARYDSDKTGRKDYALLSAGGRVISASPPYADYYEAYSFLGFRPLKKYSAPSAILSTDTQPGNCWAMNGSSGFVVVRLYRSIVLRGFSVEHVSRALSTAEERKSAPRWFSVYTLVSAGDPQPEQVGEYLYDLDSATIQTYTVESVYETGIVMFVFSDNHGNDNYTCIYRVRVYGDE